MPQPNSCTSDAVGPIRDPDARRVCSLAGMEIARTEVLNLLQLRDGLNIALQELESQSRKDRMIDRALLVARFTRATCDTFISMAGALGKAAIPGTAGEEVGKFADSYAASAPLIEAAATSASGGKVDWVKAGATSIKEGVSAVTDNVGAQILVKTTVVQVETIKAAMNHDKEGIIRPAAEYLLDLNITISEMTGKKGKWGAALAKIAKSAFEYNEKIGAAFDQLIEDDLDSKERGDALKRNIAQQAKLLSRKIDEMGRFITSCEYELNKDTSRVCR